MAACPWAFPERWRIGRKLRLCVRNCSPLKHTAYCNQPVRACAPRPPLSAFAKTSMKWFGFLSHLNGAVSRKNECCKRHPCGAVELADRTQNASHPSTCNSIVSIYTYVFILDELTKYFHSLDISIIRWLIAVGISSCLNQDSPTYWLRNLRQLTYLVTSACFFICEMGIRATRVTSY